MPARSLKPPFTPETPAAAPLSDRPVPGLRRVTVVRGTEEGVPMFEFQELWEYRELAFLLAWRDIKLRYAQTLLGVVWTVLQPLVSSGIFTLLFGKLAKVSADGIPYAIFSYLGLVPWLFYTNVIGRCSGSLVVNNYLISRIYFPRILLPVGALLPGIVDFAIGLAAALPLLWYYGYVPALASFLWVPIFALVLSLQALGLSLVFSAINVKYRDIGSLVPVAIQMGLWLTPISYPLSLVPERWKGWVALNPVVGLIEGIRSSILGKPLDWYLLSISIGFTVVVMGVGVFYFRRVECTFADVI